MSLWADNIPLYQIETKRHLESLNPIEETLKKHDITIVTTQYSTPFILLYESRNVYVSNIDIS